MGNARPGNRTVLLKGGEREREEMAGSRYSEPLWGVLSHMNAKDLMHTHVLCPEKHATDIRERCVQRTHIAFQESEAHSGKVA